MSQRFITPEGASLSTRAVRAGQIRSHEGEHNDAIFATSSFVFDSAAEAAARFAEREPGNVYSRFTNPTVRTFEDRLASMENGSFAVATSSGMAAILSTCLGTLKAGDHVIAADSLFGSTLSLFRSTLSRFGVETDFVSATDPDAWCAALKPNTRLFFVESPTNPRAEIADIAALAAIADGVGAKLVVDNCYCTPVFQRPLELGAHVVVHSATKYLDGQGRCVGGAVVTRDKKVSDAVRGVVRTGGTSLSPFNAWVFLKGLETLPIRMEAHSRGGDEVARWLARQPLVREVYYCGLESHPQHDLARRQQSGFGGLVSFEIEGGREEAFAFIDATQWLSITANFGDAKSTITHPATTTHGRLKPEERLEAGISESLIRVSVGLESIRDVIAELALGFDTVGGRTMLPQVAVA